MGWGAANACVVCDDLDFDSLLVESRRGEESGRSVAYSVCRGFRFHGHCGPVAVILRFFVFALFHESIHPSTLVFYIFVHVELRFVSCEMCRKGSLQGCTRRRGTGMDHRSFCARRRRWDALLMGPAGKLWSVFFFLLDIFPYVRSCRLQLARHAEARAYM
jgi:hypothetical protein